MSDFSHRIDLAVAWFGRHMIDGSAGGAGWGWVPDVPPNPQNTAEVVCALTHIGRPIPSHADALRLIRCEVVDHASRGDWAFRSLIDVAWRLRALRCLVKDDEDPDIVACASALVDAQEPGTGGWRLAGSAGPVSITATCGAVLALMGLEGPIATEAAVRSGLAMLIGSIIQDDPRADPLYASAQAVDVLARPEIALLGGPRTERAREKALDRVVASLTRGHTGIQEEVFTRGAVTDIWRHMTLYLSLIAVAEAAPERVFEPAFRQALIEMMDLQQGQRDNINLGGFRTSEEGFVTSYATTQALHVLASIKTTLAERVNPALTFDLLCRSSGTHHSDPQDVLKVGRTTVTMNSGAGVAVLAVGLVAAVTTGGLSIGFAGQLGRLASSLLLIWSAGFLAVGTFLFAAVRLPHVANSRIAVAVFTVFSAIFLPIIFFVVS
ncbi:MAG TPA: hypothetical protein VHT29_05095 [Solirubrobacteraceae bacterium]|jgi:hypothetical protein|nr:hypothetical protein [Solirubrobacteraceae bacterium]